MDNRLRRIRFVAFDVDGVLTDGRFYLTNEGVESKAFFTQDGYGIRRLLQAGIAVAVISGRRSAAVDQRMAELNVDHVRQGYTDKVVAFNELIAELGLSDADCAYVGDDIPDLPLLRQVGFSVAVANAVTDVRDECDYITSARGGFGAVREVCELVLAAQDTSDS